MTMTEHEAKIVALIAAYNAAMAEEVVDKNKIDTIEANLKEASIEAKKERRNEVYGALMKHPDPMLEAARMMSFQFPSYTIVKEDGIDVGAEPALKSADINAADFSNRLIKVAEQKDCPYERVGVIKHGHSWEYRAEKLAYLLTYRTIKKYDGTSKEIEEFKKSYAIREIAMKEEMGQTPTSNSQICKLLQSIIDMLVFVPTEKGTNEVKARVCDVEFLLDMFVKHGRGAGAVEVLKGKKIKDYIFEVCHMIVTGKMYTVGYAKKKGDGEEQNAPQRKPVEGKKVSAEAENTKVSKSKKVSAKTEDKPIKVSKPAKKSAPKADETPAAETEKVSEVAAD